MAGADSDITDVLVNIIQAVRDSNTLSQRMEIVVVNTNPLLRVQLAGAKEIADHLFFLTSMLMTGLPCS